MISVPKLCQFRWTRNLDIAILLNPAGKLVGVAGFEPATPSSRTLRSVPKLLILLDGCSQIPVNRPRIPARICPKLCQPEMAMRPALPPRLYLRRRRNAAAVWVIRDGCRMFTTGCREDDLAGAQKVMKTYAFSLDVTPGEPTLPKASMKPGTVYFVSCRQPDFPIKIGWALDVAARMRGLQCALPYPVVLLGATAGTMDYERQLHIGFHSDRLEGEWFKRSEQLMHLIRMCRVEVA